MSCASRGLRPRSPSATAVLTLVINALTKRGDRRYAASLEFEKRVWEAKSSARLELIVLRHRDRKHSPSRHATNDPGSGPGRFAPAAGEALQRICAATGENQQQERETEQHSRFAAVLDRKESTRQMLGEERDGHRAGCDESGWTREISERHEKARGELDATGIPLQRVTGGQRRSERPTEQRRRSMTEEQQADDYAKYAQRSGGIAAESGVQVRHQSTFRLKNIGRLLVSENE